MLEHPSLLSHRPLRALAISAVALIAGGFAAAGFASGGGASSAPQATAQPEDPTVVAARHYNTAVRYRERAVKLEKQLPTVEEVKKRAKITKKIAGSYRNAEHELRAALKIKPRSHQALSDLGFALRKQGRYDEALEAYDQALGLAPGYPQAIEYRGEAFLGLGRVEDAKNAYMALFAGNRALAEELLTAMKQWLIERQADPGTLDATAVEAFGEWVASRDQVARQVPPLAEQQARLWGR